LANFPVFALLGLALLVADGQPDQPSPTMLGIDLNQATRPEAAKGTLDGHQLRPGRRIL